jgi:hypothetical protein
MDKALAYEKIVWVELIADVLVAGVKLCARLFDGRRRAAMIDPDEIRSPIVSPCVGSASRRGIVGSCSQSFPLG